MEISIKDKLNFTLEMIDTLKNKDIPDAQQNLDFAAADGDLRENSDYHLCYQRLNGLNNQLVEREKLLSELRDFDELLNKYKPTGFIALGSKVQLTINSDSYEFQIVPPSIGDAASGLLASDSRVAESIIGKKAGDVIAYKDNENNDNSVWVVHVE